MKIAESLGDDGKSQSSAYGMIISKGGKRGRRSRASRKKELAVRLVAQRQDAPNRRLGLYAARALRRPGALAKDAASAFEVS